MNQLKKLRIEHLFGCQWLPYGMNVMIWKSGCYILYQVSILSLSRMTVTSVRIQEGKRYVCVLSHIYKQIPGIALSDVTVVLEMRLSIVAKTYLFDFHICNVNITHWYLTLRIEICHLDELWSKISLVFVWLNLLLCTLCTVTFYTEKADYLVITFILSRSRHLALCVIYHIIIWNSVIQNVWGLYGKNKT